MVAFWYLVLSHQYTNLRVSYVPKQQPVYPFQFNYLQILNRLISSDWELSSFLVLKHNTANLVEWT